VIALLLTVAFVAAACGANHPTAADGRVIAIYSTVIRVVAPPQATTPTTPLSDPVFVVPADTRSPISLQVQAAIVDVLHDFATLRFVDERSEAIDTADPHQPVHGGGVLITLGNVPPGGTNVTIDAERYERIGVATTYRISLQRVGVNWKPLGPLVHS